MIRQLLKRDWAMDIAILALGLFIFYTFSLGSYPIFTPDEGRYAEVAREMVATGDYVTPRVNGVAFLDKPVLYYWLQAIAISLFGVKEWAIRIFPALIGILGCIATYLSGRYLFNRRVGLLSGLILATSPLYFGGAHYANLDLEVAVFITCALLFFQTGFQTDTPERKYFFYGAYIACAFAFLTKGLIGIAFPGLIVGSWLVLTRRFDLIKRMHLIAGCLIFLALVMPWYILVQRANPDFLHYFFVTQQVTRFLSAAEFNNKTPFWFYLPVVLVGFFPWSIFLIQALIQQIRDIKKNLFQYQKELFLLLWVAIIFLFFSIPRSKIMTYILPIFPALALLTGHYLDQVWEKVRKKAIYWGIINFLVISVLFGLLLFILPYFNALELPIDLVPYFSVFAIAFILSAIAAFYFLRKETLLQLFITCSVCSVIVLMTLTLGAVHFNQGTAKPLIVRLQNIIKPNDEVVMYFRYFYDVPLYLGRRVTIVTDWNSPNIIKKDNWRRELWFGMNNQKTDDWLINEEKFWERWDTDNRVFVFLNANYFDQFKSRARSYFHLGKYNDIILLSNKPTILIGN